MGIWTSFIMNALFYCNLMICHKSRGHCISSKFVQHCRCAKKQKKNFFCFVRHNIVCNWKKAVFVSSSRRRRRQFPSRPVATCTGYVRQPEWVQAAGDDEIRENKPIEYVFISVRWPANHIFSDFLKLGHIVRRKYACITSL